MSGDGCQPSADRGPARARYARRARGICAWRQQRRPLSPVPGQFARMALDGWPADLGAGRVHPIVTTIPMTATFGLGTNSQIYGNDGTWAAYSPTFSGWHRVT